MDGETRSGGACARTRFAPAPTGWLHLGHVVNAIFVWGLGRAAGAEVLLRIEDHDRQRARREYERALLDDLDWLGFEPDRYPTADFRRGSCAGRQSDRHAFYAAAATRLERAGLLYGCTCSRQDIERSRAAGAIVGCPGRCRDRGMPLTDGVAWRMRTEPGEESFDDWLAGPQVSPVDEGSDVVVRDRHGNWTYQFAVTVDDLTQGVDLVVRGRDLLPSTGTQIRLASRLGRIAPPRFAHHPLVMKAPGRKLSKAARDSGIRDLRAAGWRPEAVIGHCARLAGLTALETPVEAHQVLALFAPDQAGRRAVSSRGDQA